MEPQSTNWFYSHQNDDAARIREFYRMYENGLGNLAEESFSFVVCDPLDSFSYCSSAQLSTEAPVNKLEDSNLKPWMIENQSCARGILPSAESYPLPSDPTTNFLAFPHYMLVHTNSGVPFQFSEESPRELDSLYYGSASSSVRPELPPRSYSSYSVDFSQRSNETISCSTLAKTYTVAEPGTSPPRRGRPKKIEGEKKSRKSKEQPLSKLKDTSSKQNRQEKENLQSQNCCLNDLKFSDDSFSSTVFSFDGDEESGASSPCFPTSEETGSQVFVKPPFSYSALVTLALKNSRTGRLTVRDIYNFMCHHYPYFRTAPAGWKNSVRHNLSLNPAFFKIVGDAGPARARTACRWTINPEKYSKMNDDILKQSAKSPELIKCSMRYPELQESIERGTFCDFRRAVEGVLVQQKKNPDCRREKKKENSKAYGKRQAVLRPRTYEYGASQEDGHQSSSPSVRSSVDCPIVSLDSDSLNDAQLPLSWAGPVSWNNSENYPTYLSGISHRF